MGHRPARPAQGRPLLADAAAVALAETFRVLGDPTRVRLLDALSQAERCVSDLARLLGSSESAISHQLRLLRGMRLVRPRRAGRLIFYALDDQHIVKLFAQGLEHVQERAPLAARASEEPVRVSTLAHPPSLTAAGDRTARDRRRVASAKRAHT